MSWRQLLRRWWMSDRIRIAPDLNRHLRLRPGQRVIMDQRLMVVVRRIEGQTGETPSVRYHLERFQERSMPSNPADEHEHSEGAREPPWVWDPMAAGDVVVIESDRDRCWIECVYER